MIVCDFCRTPEDDTDRGQIVRFLYAERSREPMSCESAIVCDRPLELCRRCVDSLKAKVAALIEEGRNPPKPGRYL